MNLRRPQRKSDPIRSKVTPLASKDKSTKPPFKNLDPHALADSMCLIRSLSVCPLLRCTQLAAVQQFSRSSNDAAVRSTSVPRHHSVSEQSIGSKHRKFHLQCHVMDSPCKFACLLEDANLNLVVYSCLMLWVFLRIFAAKFFLCPLDTTTIGKCNRESK